MDVRRTPPLGRILVFLILFGVAFGYLEAAVVCYLRDLHEPARLRFYPNRPPGELFPLLTMEEIRASGTVQFKTLAIELGREAATLVVLASVALGPARSVSHWAGAFAMIFGIWDITFYGFLKLLLNWPASLLTWDILFLIPVPWTGPVLAPLLVSAAMIATGGYQMWRESSGVPVRIGASTWLGITAGAAIIFAAFIMDYRNIMAGGMPNPFHWGIFLAGLSLGLLSYAGAAVRSRPSPLQTGTVR